MRKLALKATILLALVTLGSSTALAQSTAAPKSLRVTAVTDWTVALMWDAPNIRYYLYLNGQFDGATVDPYPQQFSMYLTLGIVNTIEVYAVDEAGNRSAAATMTIDLRTP
jgi:hypothetical protein